MTRRGLRILGMALPLLIGAPVLCANTYDPVAATEATVLAGNARFTVLTPELIRMEWSSRREFEDRASFVFVNRRLPVPKFSTERENGWLTIATEKLVLRYRDSAGRFGPDNLSVTLTLNGKPVTWHPGMEDTGNLKGTYRTLDSISGGLPLPPGLVSRDGWVVVDDSKRLLFDKVEGTDWPWAADRDQADALDSYFFGYGHDYPRAIRDFTRVAGRIPLPPRYAFGTWWSRYWAYSDEELRQLVRDFRANDVPLDVLVVDMDWHLDGWTGYTWNPKYFPDPDGFLKWVRDQGLKVTLNLHPAAGVGKHEAAFDNVARHMGLDPDLVDNVPFDCTDPRYVETYFKDIHHPLERRGVDFWWIDWQQGTSLKHGKMPSVDPLPWLNYLHWIDMERNAERRGLRPMLFSRWGKLGSHRYQIGFSGDTYNNWESLAFQPYFTSTAANVAYPFWSHDIGGHMPGPVEPELYARWIQWGALSPILRTHTTKHAAAERRLWKFPEDVYRVAKEAFHLRYALIPYIYTSARRSYDEALPLCRPLYYEWPEMQQAYEHTDTYLFGDQLLVAPVLRPANEINGQVRVKLWIPPGEWTNWFSGDTYTGPAEASLLVPLDEIPMFVRSGGIIPMQPKMLRTSERPVDPLILTIWPGESGQTRVYEDDGLTIGYQKSECAWTPVSHQRINGARHITIGPVEGSFPGMRKGRQYEVHLRHVGRVQRVTVNGRRLKETQVGGQVGWSYDLDTSTLIVRLPTTRMDQAVRVVIEPQPETSLGTTPAKRGLRGGIRMLDDVSQPVVPENLIRAQTGASSGELAEACAANNGESATNAGRFGPTIA